MRSQPKFRLLPSHSEPKNSIATLLKVLAIIIYVCGFFAGALLGAESSRRFMWEVACLFWVTAFFSGSLLLGFSEVIRILDMIAMKGYVVIANTEELRTAPPVGTAGKRTVTQTADVPGEYIDEPSNRTVNTAATAEIPEVSAKSFTFQCPACGALQRYDREVCWKCGTRFQRLN